MPARPPSREFTVLRAALGLTLAAGCGDPGGRPGGGSSSTLDSDGSTAGATSTAASSGEPEPTTGVAETLETLTSTGTTHASTGETLDTGTTEPDSSTGAPLPDFDELPWLTGEDIGHGVAYKDSLDPAARNVFIGYAGYPFPLDAAESWVTALYHARLRELGVRHVYAVQGPSKVMYSDFEIGNTSIAAALTTQAQDAAFVLVAGHSSGSYVAHELLGQLASGHDPRGVTEDRVVYFNLDGGTAYLDDPEVARLRRAYFVSVHDGETGTDAPNLGAMQLLGDQWPDKGGYLELDGGGAGCDAGAQWCLHMAVITSSPHDKSDSDVIDYYDFVDRPVVTSWFDVKADEAGLHP